MEIIIVDDEPVSLTVLKQLISKLPHCHARGFTQASAALAWCQPNDPDVVIVDYMMPELNGIEFSRRLCALQGRADTPLLMVSASEDPSLRRSALQHGVSDFMNKPVDFVELQARIRDMMTLRSNQIRIASHTVTFATELASSTIGAPEQDRVLNVNITRARLAGDDALLAEVAGVFRRTAPQLLASISTALSGNCLERAYSEAHSLKGAVGAFEAPAVLDAVTTLERNAKNHNISAATAAFSCVESLVERLLDELLSIANPTA
jgi:CheY-like chemotaxis protein/HPt (histidine-containing phosphotransfer) domain-containing protein